MQKTSQCCEDAGARKVRNRCASNCCLRPARPETGPDIRSFLRLVTGVEDFPTDRLFLR